MRTAEGNIKLSRNNRGFSSPFDANVTKKYIYY